MIGLYRAGTSVVHRAPAGPKLALLAAGAVTLSLLPLNAAGHAAALAVVCALYGIARLPVREPVAQAWRLRGIVAVLGAFLWISSGPLAAWIGVARLLEIVMLAGLLTLTTRADALMAVLRRAVAPLRRFGADPDAVALSLSLTITMVPVIAGFADQVREAERARGVRAGVRVVVPLLVRTLRHADEVGDALIARGLGSSAASGDDRRQPDRALRR